MINAGESLVRLEGKGQRALAIKYFLSIKESCWPKQGFYKKGYFALFAWIPKWKCKLCFNGHTRESSIVSHSVRRTYFLAVSLQQSLGVSIVWSLQGIRQWWRERLARWGNEWARSSMRARVWSNSNSKLLSFSAVFYCSWKIIPERH